MSQGEGSRRSGRIVAAAVAAVVVPALGLAVANRGGPTDSGPAPDAGVVEPSPTAADSPDGLAIEEPTTPEVGPPLVRAGPMPGTILAVSEVGEVVTINVETRQWTLLWDGAEVNTEATEESTANFIESVAFAAPTQVLIGVCCEPVSGQVWFLDLASAEPPRRLPIDGAHPAISPSGMLAVSDGFGVKGVPLVDLVAGSGGLVPTYYYEELAGADADVAWLGDRIVFDRRAGGPAGVVEADVVSGAVSLSGGDVGWERPSGSSDSDIYVVAEQCCWDPVDGTITETSTLLAVSDASVAPVAVGTIQGGVADIDLDRGWLLVTRSSGAVGVVDPEDGSFVTLAEGLRTAVWFE